MTEAGGTAGSAPPPSVDPDTHVCVRCGRPATDKDFCVCGANLNAMRGMLPTRAEWEKANPEKAAAPPPEPPPPPKEPAPHTRPIKWEGLSVPLSERMRKQILPSILAIAIFAAIVIFGSGSGSPKTASNTASAPATVVSQTTTTTATTTTTHAPTGPTAAVCATAWNGGRSPTHRHILDLAVASDQPPVALLAVYRGRALRLARLGGGSKVSVTPNACVVAAHTSVFIQQPNGTWGLVSAGAGSPFAVKPGAPQWGQGHHNATVTVGPLHGGPADVGAVTPTGRRLPGLR